MKRLLLGLSLLLVLAYAMACNREPRRTTAPAAAVAGSPAGYDRQRALGLGMTNTEVEAAYGPVDGYVTFPGPQRFRPDQLQAALVAAQTAFMHAYIRKTALSEYELRLSYNVDTSASRLHPAMRLHQVLIEIDRPLSAAVVLPDLVEARELCQEGCDVRASRYGDDGLDVCPSAASLRALKGKFGDAPRLTLTAEDGKGMRSLSDFPSGVGLWSHPGLGCDGRIIAKWNPPNI